VLRQPTRLVPRIPLSNADTAILPQAVRAYVRVLPPDHLIKRDLEPVCESAEPGEQVRQILLEVREVLFSEVFSNLSKLLYDVNPDVDWFDLKVAAPKDALEHGLPL
jgi:hypothetical protein